MLNLEFEEKSPSIAETLKTLRVSLSRPSSSSNPRCSKWIASSRCSTADSGVWSLRTS